MSPPLKEGDKMAKKNKLNLLQIRHQDDDLKTEQSFLKESIQLIFIRIYAETFSEYAISKAKTYPELPEKLDDLKKELEAFEKQLLEEIEEKPLIKFQNKEDHSALKAARRLNVLMENYFFQSSLPEKKKEVHQFRDHARGAWFTRRLKMSVTTVVVGIVIFALAIGLIIGTGGLSLMGVGAIIGISVAIGAVAAGIAAFLGYKLFSNKNETRGKGIVEKLKVLSEDVGIHSFITNRNNHLLKEKAEHPLRLKYAIPRKASTPESGTSVVLASSSTSTSTQAKLLKLVKGWIGQDYENETPEKITPTSTPSASTESSNKLTSSDSPEAQPLVFEDTLIAVEPEEDFTFRRLVRRTSSSDLT